MITADFKNIEIIPLSQGGGSGGEGVEIKNQAKSVTITENGTQTVRYDSGYTGLSQVGLTVDVPIEEYNSQTKSVELNTNGIHSVMPDEGYDGLSEVEITVDVPTEEFETQTKEVVITENGTMTVEPDSDFDGLIKVTINTDVAVPSFKTQDKNLTITENSTMTITPDEGYIGLSEVGITVNVPNSGGSGSGEGGNIFSAIGYPSTPDFITEGIAYAEEIQNNWQSNYASVADRLVFFPLVDTTQWYNHFTNCNKLLYVPAIDVSNRTHIGSMFEKCASLTGVECGNWDVSKCTSFLNTFNGCSSLTMLDVSNWDTSNVTDMRYMFNGCSSLTDLDVSNWDTSKVTNMNNLFAEAKKLTTLDVSNWDTSKVTEMKSMFYYCSSLTSLDLSKWDITNVSKMTNMFQLCNSMTSLDVSGWDTSNVTDMSYLFNSCGVFSLDLSNWDTSNVTDMSSMFYNMGKIKELNLGNFTMAKVKGYTLMFNAVSELRDFIWNNFGDGQSVTSFSFSSSNKLGVNDDTYTNARQHLTDTFVTNSYDRASAGYSACKVSFMNVTKALFTEEEIAAMTAKGYTIA